MMTRTIREETYQLLRWYEEQSRKNRPGFRLSRRKKFNRLMREAERMVEKALQSEHQNHEPR